MSSNNQNSQIISIAIIIFSFTLIFFGPIMFENGANFNIGPGYEVIFEVIFLFSLGFMFILFLFCFLAIKQRRNFYG